jgi:phosphoglycerate kinase
MMSHLGRPKGEVKKEFSLLPVAEYLSEKLNQEVTLSETCLDSGIKTLLSLNTNNIILLENLRFHKEETKNDPEFAQTLASYADYYVLDAFGTAHREHASTYGIMHYFPHNRCLAGFLMKKEIEALTQVVEKPSKPFVSIVGGAKVSDKIKIIEKLLVSSDKLLIGGAMAYPFLKSQGHSIGKSLCQEEDVDLAKDILKRDHGKKIELPVDHLASKEFGGAKEVVPATDIPDDLMGLDIGEATINKYKNILSSAKTVLWNGPMGLFENSDFAAGTFAIANTLAELPMLLRLLAEEIQLVLLPKQELPIR